MTGAREARLDALAINAIHMFAFIDTAPAEQLRWGQAALEVVLGSSQDGARRWEASVRNNIGVALGQRSRHEEALAIQLRLEREFDAVGQPDPYVFEELEALYRARGDADKAGHYGARRAAATSKP